MKKIFKSNKKGAVIIARNSFNTSCGVYRANVGIIKKRGCWYYRHVSGASARRYMSPSACKLRYYDYPAAGEAWLVYPFENGRGYYWEPIKIGFTR